MESSVRSWCMIYLLSLIDSSMVLHTYFIRRDLLKVRNEFMSEVGVLLIWDIQVSNRKKKNLPIQNSENLDLSLGKLVILGSSLIYMCECECVCLCVCARVRVRTPMCVHTTVLSAQNWKFQLDPPCGLVMLLTLQSSSVVKDQSKPSACPVVSPLYCIPPFSLLEDDHNLYSITISTCRNKLVQSTFVNCCTF